MGDSCHYRVLRLLPSASAEEVRAAYHARALACHPDKGGAAPAFLAVQRAWEVLLGPVKTGDVACIEMVLELATKHDMHAAVVPILAELSHRVGDRSGRSMLWREVARRKEQFLGDTEGAFEAWVSAAVALVDAEDLARIDALAPQVKRPQRVADAYKAALDGCGDPTLAHELSMRGLGAIEASGGRVQAFEYALAALAKAPADDEVLDAVVRLVPSSRRHSDLFVAFDRRKKAAQSDATSSVKTRSPSAG